MRGLGVAVLLALAGPAAADDDAGMIRQRLLDWRAAFNARDADGACDLFAPDLAYSVPDVTRGTHQTMCDNFARIFAKPGLTLAYAEPLIHEIILSGDTAIVRLTWTLTAESDGGRETSTEEGMDIFTRQPDGRWSISRFIAF